MSGSIASGKTTLAEALQVAFPCSVRLAFGDVVRRRVLIAKREPTRRNLQDMGLKLINEGWSLFLDDLLSDLETDPEVLIVEGIRHREAVDALTERLPIRKLLLIYVEIGSEQRRQRLACLGETEDATGQPVERGVSDLRATADLVVSTQQPVEKLVERVRRIIECQTC